MSRRLRPVVVALLAFALGLALRAALVDRHGLWVDEVFSLAMATGHGIEHPASRAVPALGDYVESPRPLPPSAFRVYAEHEAPPAGPGRVVRAVRMSDTSPPLYYLLLYVWTLAAGTTDSALRGFTVFWWAASVPLVWQLGRSLGGRRAASAAVTLFSFSPLSVFYGTEGRMYSLLWFFTLAAASLTLRLGLRGARPATVALWALASAGGLLTHYFFLFVWSAFVSWLLVFPGRSRRASTVAAVLSVGVLIAPWYILLPESLAGWRVTSDWLQMRPERFHPAVAFGKLAWSYVSAAGVWWGESWTKARAALNVSLLLLIAAAFALARHRVFGRRRVLLVWLWLAAALAGPQAFDLARHTYTVAVPRYAITGMPAAYLLIALALRAARRPAGPVILAMIVLSWVPSHLLMLSTDTRHYAPFRPLGRIMAERVTPADLVLVHSIPSGAVALARYVPSGSGLERGAGMASWVERLGVRTVPDGLLALAEGRRRVVLVRVHDVGQPSPEEDWLRRNARLVGEDHLEIATVLYFVPAGGSDVFTAGDDSGPTRR
jgi:hypothetical protein